MQKSYYAIIPANVRYNKNLTDGAKLLYGEITALCNEKGYCWATNGYFSELYGVTKVTISRWIKSLIDEGYIESELKYKEGSKEIDSRYIQICYDPINKNDNTPINKNDKDNNTSINNTKEYIYILFDYWNEKEIIKHRKKTQAMESHINARLQEYSVDELKKAIDNYSLVLKSNDYYWTHKWTLQDFMKPSNVIRFVDDADPLNNFKSNKKEKINKKGGIDLNDFNLDD